MSDARTANTQRWLDAFSEPHAAIYTFTHCMTLADLNGDNDYKLIVADLGTGSVNIKLKVYKGTSLSNESTLIDVPTGVVSFHMDISEPRIPAVAVASGPNIYVYKNMRPYFKFSLPPLEVNVLERDLWLQMRENCMDVEVFYEQIQNLRQDIGVTNLTSQSQQLLLLDHDKWKSFVQAHVSTPLKKQTVITSITTLNKNMAEKDAVACLVVGTENGGIYVLDPEAFTVLENMSLSGCSSSNNTVPVHMVATGLFDVDYRIVCACRDGTICLLRRGLKEAKVLVQLSTQVVAMVIVAENNNIVTALMDNTIRCFSRKGKKQWEIKTPKDIYTMGVVPLEHLSLTLLAVALAGGTVQLYDGRQLVDIIAIPDTVSAILFGHFGQEENTLIMITVGGSLFVKILKRTAHFTAQNESMGLIPAQQMKLAVPKKTKLFVEHTMRERENAIAMHRTFQHDLFRLRLNTARACVRALQSRNTPVSASSVDPLQMMAQVLGLGPKFKLYLTLENMSVTSVSKNLAISFHCDDKMYKVEKPLILVPVLIPGLTYQFETGVECVSELGISDQIRIFIVKLDHPEPLLAVMVAMPACDALTNV